MLRIAFAQRSTSSSSVLIVVWWTSRGLKVVKCSKSSKSERPTAGADVGHPDLGRDLPEVLDRAHAVRAAVAHEAVDLRDRSRP